MEIHRWGFDRLSHRRGFDRLGAGSSTGSAAAGASTGSATGGCKWLNQSVEGFQRSSLTLSLPYPEPVEGYGSGYPPSGLRQAQPPPGLRQAQPPSALNGFTNQSKGFSDSAVPRACRTLSLSKGTAVDIRRRGFDRLTAGALTGSPPGLRQARRRGFDRLGRRRGFDRLSCRRGFDRLSRRWGFDWLGRRRGFGAEIYTTPKGLKRVLVSK